MRIRALKGLAGDGFQVQIGEEKPWPDNVDARRLIAAGHAEAVRQRVPETAVRKTGPERAVKR